jgi:SAM-dependent methyltransferase
MLREIARALRSKRLTRADGGHAPSGVALPPAALRMGGAHFLDNEVFVATAKRDVARLAEHGLTRDSALLDWGCGAGRLAIGVIETWGGIARYDGVDVQKDLVSWATRHLARDSIAFTHVDLANARYNRNGRAEHRIPGDASSYDALYGYSVLSHMDDAELGDYLREIRRLLRPEAFAWLTAFVEDGVPEVSENPEGYGPIAWEGALHCVRFERTFFESMARSAGLEVSHFEHGQETDGQSLYVLRPALGRVTVA